MTFWLGVVGMFVGVSFGVLLMSIMQIRRPLNHYHGGNSNDRAQGCTAAGNAN